MSALHFIRHALLALTLLLAACDDSPTAPQVEEIPSAEVEADFRMTRTPSLDAQTPGGASTPIGAGPLLATTSGWVHYSRDPISFSSANGKAKAVGSVNWYVGSGVSTRRRADYTNGTKVYATEAVGCIWAKVSFGYPTGGVTVGAGGAAGSISGGTKVGSYYSSCRTSPGVLPAPLQLGGVDFAQSFLNSTTVEICTSTSKAQGPLHCARQKRYYLNAP